MIIGIGTDIIEVERIKRIVEKYGIMFLDKIFTETEQSYSDSFKYNKYLHYAARFAAKESFSKAIGTGMTDGFRFKEIGIRNDENGKPVVELAGKLAEKWNKYTLHVSLSHTKDYAIAVIVIEE